MKTISILGASSFVSISFIEFIQKYNEFELKLLCREKKKLNQLFYNKKIKIYFYEPRNIKSINKDFFKTDIIINFLGNYNDQSIEFPNYILPLLIFKESLSYNVRNWINLSSIGVYDKSFYKIDENTPENPINKYEKLKLKLDKDLINLSQTHNIKLIILRPSSIIGISMKSDYLRRLIQIVKFRLFFFIEDKNSIANLVNVEDLNSILFECIKSEDKNSNIYNISENISYADLIQIIKNRLQIYSKEIILTKKIAYLISFILFNKILSKSRIKNLTNKNYYSSKKLMEEYNFKFNHGIKKSLVKIIDEKYRICNN